MFFYEILIKYENDENIYEIFFPCYQIYNIELQKMY